VFQVPFYPFPYTDHTLEIGIAMIAEQSNEIEMTHHRGP
jgi:hypothetical protein